MADVVRLHEPDFVAARRGRVTAAERRVLRAISECRTEALGGHVDRCDECGHQEISYNSCRNRHCPKCQASARNRWAADREQDLLPVEYFHVVFTLPKEIASIAMQNKRVVYSILFRTSAETLREVAADPKHLGAQIGVLSVLHTWGQNLQLHPHVHCVVPGGGLSPDGCRWVACRHGFLLPVRVLGRVYRGKFLQALKRAYVKGELKLVGQLEHLNCQTEFNSYLDPLYRRDWFVYSKPPFGGPKQVLKYLSRYTHRVAISNGRLVRLESGKVSFRWKDYAHRGRKGLLTLGVVEFLRRFLLHLLPKGFVRIRHYGFLANRCRVKKIETCRKLLEEGPLTPSLTCGVNRDRPDDVGAFLCPSCKRGHMATVRTFEAHERIPLEGIPPPRARAS